MSMPLSTAVSVPTVSTGTARAAGTPDGEAGEPAAFAALLQASVAAQNGKPATSVSADQVPLGDETAAEPGTSPLPSASTGVWGSWPTATAEESGTDGQPVPEQSTDSAASVHATPALAAPQLPPAAVVPMGTHLAGPDDAEMPVASAGSDAAGSGTITEPSVDGAPREREAAVQSPHRTGESSPAPRAGVAFQPSGEAALESPVAAPAAPPATAAAMAAAAPAAAATAVATAPATAVATAAATPVIVGATSTGVRPTSPTTAGAAPPTASPSPTLASVVAPDRVAPMPAGAAPSAGTAPSVGAAPSAGAAPSVGAAASVVTTAPHVPPTPVDASTTSRQPEVSFSFSPVPVAPPQGMPPVTVAPVSSAPPVPPAPLAAQVAPTLFTLVGAKPGEHVLTINVAPDNLGPVTVRAHVTVDSLRVELFAPTDAGRDALRAIMPDLRRDLAGTGLTAQLDLSSENSAAGRDPQKQRTPDARSLQPEQETRGHADSGPRAHRASSASTIDVLA
ncbi:MAG TPA: flagellar hook-length control protein FliK [Glaciibacter sp.]|nr:flagellar hook-length control protein FliK [Glaciibacter sp.]